MSILPPPISCKVLLDSCSTRTHITRKAAEKIRAPVVSRRSHQISGFGAVKHRARWYDVVEVVIEKSTYGASLPIQAVVVDKICMPVEGGYVQKNVQAFPHIRGLPLADDEVGDSPQEVSILIGIDFYYDIIIGEPIKCKGAPTIVNSIFGFVVSGDVGGSLDEDSSMVLLTDHVSNEDLMTSVKDFFEIESAGVEEDDLEETEEFKLNIEKRSDRYYVNYPRKSYHPPLGDNYNVAQKRLRSGVKRMIQDDELRKDYCDIMQQQEDDMIIEEVPLNDFGQPGNTYDMPHHAVVRRDKLTSKTRIVYDCSSKESASPEAIAALNECLVTGTCAFTDLLSVLIRFRIYKIGLSSDIEKAFLQVGVKEEDRDLTRFQWVQDPRSMTMDFKLRRMRFCRVTFGIVSSMAILDHVNQHHLKVCEERYPDTVKMITNSLYIDDCNGGAETVSDGLKAYEETKTIYNEAGMNMRKWVTNDPELQEMIDVRENASKGDSIDGEISYASSTLNPQESAPTKILGTPWDIVTDELIFSLKALNDFPAGRITKRMLLSATMRPFDPMGILTVIIVSLKILFQQVCKDGGDWNDYLEPKHQAVWDKFLLEAKEFPGIRLPRRYGDMFSGEVMLIGFGDASEAAYAACVYVRSKVSSGEVSTSIVAAKTRVAKVKKETTPRLELRASHLLTKLMTKTKDAFEKVIPIQKIVCATDAEIVLYQIQGENKQYKAFVQNRCEAIRRQIAISHWFHVPGLQNPADLPSRGCYPGQLQDSKTLRMWLHGPEWLKDDEEFWPLRKDVKMPLEDLELKGSDLRRDTIDCLVTTTAPSPSIHEFFDYERYGTLSKTIRVLAWCRRFIHNYFRKDKPEEMISGELSADECSESKERIIRSIQGEMLSESGHEKRVQSLGVFRDDSGILRCRGRIGKSNLAFGTKYPTLLPRYHHVTKLIICDAHESVYHNGVSETLAEVRSAYWIVKGRQAVKQVLHRCFICRKLEGMAYPSPVTCDLPQFRVGANRAFETTGVDYCGPVYLKGTDKANEGNIRKSYIAIFTCAATRMVHLEIAPDLTTAAYVRCQRRFIARRFRPKMIVSDNGKTFKGQALKKYNAKKGIKWRFNLARAPWWGGMFERLVRSTKRCLVKEIGLRKLTHDELSTVLAEIENVINNRPLVYVGEEDFNRPLTPSHLYCGQRTMDDPDSHIPEVKNDITGKEAVSRVKLINSSIEHFWGRWAREYLVSLRETHKLKMKSKSFNINEGDAVLIYEDGRKRCRWPTGIVEKVVKGADGVVRGAILRKLGGDGSRQTIERPLQKLYPLEISSNVIDSASTVTESTNDAATSVKDRIHEDVESNDEFQDDSSDVQDNVSEFDATSDIDAANDVADHVASDIKDDSRDTMGKRGPRRRAAIVGNQRRRQQQIYDDYDSFDEFDGVND